MIEDSIHNNQKRKEQEKLEALEEGHFQEVIPKFFEQLRERTRQF